MCEMWFFAIFQMEKRKKYTQNNTFIFITWNIFIRNNFSDCSYINGINQFIDIKLCSVNLLSTFYIIELNFSGLLMLLINI